MQDVRLRIYFHILKTIDNARDDLAVRRIINVPETWDWSFTTVNRVQDSAQMRRDWIL